jgi:hypothetical protein
MMLGRGDSTKVVYRDGGILYFKRLECGYSNYQESY